MPADYALMRSRKYTYFEMLNFARMFADNRDADTPANLLRDFLRFKTTHENTDMSLQKVQLIEHATVEYFDLSLDAVRSKRRYRELVTARQVIAYLCVKFTSEENVAAAIGGNRNNVHYSKTKCGIMMETEPHLVRQVEAIENIARQAIDEHIKKIVAFEDQFITENLTPATNENSNTEQ